MGVISATATVSAALDLDEVSVNCHLGAAPLQKTTTSSSSSSPPSPPPPTCTTPRCLADSYHSDFPIKPMAAFPLNRRQSLGYRHSTPSGNLLERTLILSSLLAEVLRAFFIKAFCAPFFGFALFRFDSQLLCAFNYCLQLFILENLKLLSVRAIIHLVFTAI